MPNYRVIACGLFVGVLFAFLLGVNLSTSSSNDPEEGVRTAFAPALASFGFLLGGTFGWLVGDLWNRKGFLGAVGSLLVVLVCGFAGLVAAGFFGAETRVTITEHSRKTEYGAPQSVLIAGAVAGVLLGTAIAWRFGRFRSGAVAA